MSLSIPIRIAIKEAVLLQARELIQKEGKPSSQAQNKWKFKNASDWHYGHFVGMMECLSREIIEKFLGVQPTFDQMKEVEEIIEEHSKDLRDYFLSFDSD